MKTTPWTPTQAYGMCTILRLRLTDSTTPYSALQIPLPTKACVPGSEEMEKREQRLRFIACQRGKGCSVDLKESRERQRHRDSGRGGWQEDKEAWKEG